MTKTKTPAAKFTAPVEFGNVSIGDGTVGLSIKIDRTHLDPQQADDLLCGRRLQSRLAVGKPGDDVDQTYLFDDAEHKLTASFDVKGFAVKPKHIRATFCGALADLEIEELGHFAKRAGRLLIDAVSELEDTSDDRI